MILLDCMMAGMDGYEAARLIKARAPALTVIAMTARAEAEEKERCVKAGMDGCLIKPFSANDLAAVLTALVVRQRPAVGIGLLKDEAGE